MTKHIPYTRDVIQEVNGNLASPEIRVWCHPHRIGKTGSDYYYTFKTFKAAEKFIAKHKEAEDSALIAFAGKEINIYTLRQVSNG
jgi:hypothetical protein